MCPTCNKGLISIFMTSSALMKFDKSDFWEVTISMTTYCFVLGSLDLASNFLVYLNERWKWQPPPLYRFQLQAGWNPYTYNKCCHLYLHNWLWAQCHSCTHTCHSSILHMLLSIYTGYIQRHTFSTLKFPKQVWIFHIKTLQGKGWLYIYLPPRPPPHQVSCFTKLELYKYSGKTEHKLPCNFTLITFLLLAALLGLLASKMSAHSKEISVHACATHRAHKAQA